MLLRVVRVGHLVRRPWERRYDRAVAVCFAACALLVAGWLFVASAVVVVSLAALLGAGRLARRARPRPWWDWR